MRSRIVLVSLLVLAALLVTPAAIADPLWSDFPADQVAEATSSAGAVVTWTDPTAADAATSLVVSCAPLSGSTFALGNTTVTCTATEPVSGVTVLTDDFTVTVEDTTDPVVSVPSDITTEATGPGGAAVTFSASASDIVDGSVSTSCAPSSGSTFALGTTTVTCSATDSNGNTGSASFGVTVRDTAAPSVTVPANITTPATGPSGATVSFSASATDLVDSSPSVVCAPPSGSTFPLGTTTVTCVATDDSGNSDGDSFTVTVQDSTAPSLTVPGNITAEATGPGGASVGFTATASDAVDPTPTVSCSPSSGSTFPIAATTVSCTASDDSGNQSAAQTFTVTVRDTTAPSISVPGDILAEATGPIGAPVSFSASATDIVSGTIIPSCNPASGTMFSIGVTNVTCTATDGRGNAANGTFRVTVRDTTAPVFGQVPLGITAEADGPGGARATYVSPSAADLVNGPVLVACVPGSGGLFPLGTTTVTCTARDAPGNASTAAFPVKVVDTTKPALTVPQDQTFSSGGATTLAKSAPQVGAFLDLASARDLVDGAVSVTNDAPEVFPLGTTRVTFSAKDRAGNTATAPADLTVVTTPVAPQVQDTTPPKDVTKLTAKPGDRFVELSWLTPKTDFDHVRISRTPGKNGASASQIYRGSAAKVKDAKLTNGTEYRYVAVAYDKAGNFSPGAIVRAVPKRPLLYQPYDGRTVTKPPVLRWIRVAGASYYNVQLYRGRAAVPRAKIFTAWPAKPQVALERKWKFNGKTHRLTPGTYVWLAWPGLGPKTANRYGPMIGQSTFVVKASP
jgi:hypothetical protein